MGNNGRSSSEQNKRRVARAKALRLQLKLDRGGKCEICGYDKCLRALAFHHRDKCTKLFSLGYCTGKTLRQIREEVDKCDLLCANCHAEVEDGLHG